ncbi:hypothetical protein F5144DRAFT_540517 [Chaetomium tenue]|uniref:Uncharacterized protein n=1 Tax=Chaetomium tenue TaxID=1854479 RepID=A0ACB7P4I7_9PEZI|nr:hypothetical protein F5144DRAFT_540517 [Chaetomium globosum]
MSGRDTRYDSRNTEAPRIRTVTREPGTPSSSLPLRPTVRAVPVNAVDGNPDDRRPRPRRQEATRPAANAQGPPAGPPQPKPSAAKRPSDLPPPPTAQPLSIKKDGGPAENLAPEMLGAVYRVIKLALDTLEQDRSFNKLIHIGATCVQDWGARNNPKEIIYPVTPSSNERYRNKKPSDAEMGRWVDIYLKKIRQCFPPIDIRRLEDGTHAMFGLVDWVQDAKEQCSRARKPLTNENVMLHWHPLDSGVMRLHLDTLTAVAQVRASYLKAKEKGDKDGIKRFGTDYRVFLVDGAFTVAHELVHCFVRFLSGDRKIGTPRSLLPKGFEDRPTRGESGRMWEELVFGGCVTYSLPSKPGAFVRLMVEKDGKEAQVDPDHVKEISQGKLRFPLKTIGKWEEI